MLQFPMVERERAREREREREGGANVIGRSFILIEVIMNMSYSTYLVYKS